MRRHNAFMAEYKAATASAVPPGLAPLAYVPNPDMRSLIPAPTTDRRLLALAPASPLRNGEWHFWYRHQQMANVCARNAVVHMIEPPPQEHIYGIWKDQVTTIKTQYAKHSRLIAVVRGM